MQSLAAGLAAGEVASALGLGRMSAEQLRTALARLTLALDVQDEKARGQPPTSAPPPPDLPKRPASTPPIRTARRSASPGQRRGAAAASHAGPRGNLPRAPRLRPQRPKCEYP